jgi:methyl-accepting chemotaxis protein/aerotaxis receptor
MRLNLPTTNDERHLADGDSVISRTDLHGIITYVNSTFCEISGYAREELIGQPHNIVRHPDMPTAVFADAWATLRAGKTWQGLIKNRCKNGGFYWVEANANPIHVDGEIVGYMSLRTRPAAQQVARAEHAYAALRSTQTPGRWRLQRGRIIDTSWRGVYGRLRRPSLRDRIAAIVVVLAMSGLAAAISALTGMAASNAELAHTQNAHLLPSQQMGAILRKMMENRILTIDAAGRPTPEVLAECRRRVVANQNDIAALIESYRAGIDSPEQRQLLERWNTSRLRYKASIDATLLALERGEYERAADILVTAIPQSYEPLAASTTALIEQHANASARALREAEASRARHWAFALTLLLASAAMSGWLGVVLYWAVMRPLVNARHLASAISSGDLTARAAVRSDDDIGEMVQSTLNIAGNLRGLTRDVVIAGNATSEGTFRIAEDAQDIALHMVEQRQAATGIAAQAQALRESAAIQLEHATATHMAASNAAGQAANGSAALQQVIYSIDDVHQAANRIGDIVAVMTSIATQTDILALNASENARTGEHQRAFSQIVDEIRNLARRSHSASGGARALMTAIAVSLDRTNAALGQCRELLDGIHAESSQVVQRMTSSIEGAQAQAFGATIVDAELAQLTRIAGEGTELSLRTIERAALLRRSAELLLERMAFFTLPAGVPLPADSTTPDHEPASAAIIAAARN